MITAFLLASCIADSYQKIDMTLGQGLQAAKGDVVTVLYKGNLLNGLVFDKTDEAPPYAFELGAAKVIKGWDQGIEGMKVGGRRILSLPPEMAYGDKGMEGVIPEKSTLVFDIQLIRVDKKGAEQKLEIEETTVGTGAEAVDGKDVEVNYKGTFLNGHLFDRTDKAPYKIKLGVTRLIKGFTDGVRGMKVGGRRKVTIPYLLAYGEKGRSGIPPRATLVFELEVVSVK